MFAFGSFMKHCSNNGLALAVTITILTTNLQIFGNAERFSCEIYNTCKYCISPTKLTSPKCKWLLEEQKCADTNSKSVSKTIKNIKECPNYAEYEIESFEPTVGLNLGGTLVNITVRNIHNFNKTNTTMIAKSITVVGRECKFEPMNKFNKTILCTVDTSSLSNTTVGPVIIEYPETKLVSKQNFSFVDLEMYNDFSPKCGPSSGNTTLTINGQNFNVVDEVRVSIGNITCRVVARQSNRIRCLTGASGTARPGPVNVMFRGIVKDSGNRLFSYAGDPSADRNQNYGGIGSGGTWLLVRGRFNCVQNPKMFVVDDLNRTIDFDDCATDTRETAGQEPAKTVFCQTPPLDSPVSPIRYRIGLSVEYAGRTVNVLSPDSAADFYVLHPDPVFVNFVIDGTTVTVNGKFAYTGYQLGELTVSIADTGDKCEVKTVNGTTIVCQTATAVANVQEIIVAAGRTLKTPVTMKNEQQKIEAQEPPTVLSRHTLGTVVVTLLFGLVLCAVTITWMKSKKQTEKRYLTELRDITAGVGDKLL